MLVETEWLDFGHKFGDRCGHQEKAGDVSEQCPVFLQWLDCVHQLQRQFPCSFEFNEAFLVSQSALASQLQQQEAHSNGCLFLSLKSECWSFLIGVYMWTEILHTTFFILLLPDGTEVYGTIQRDVY